MTQNPKKQAKTRTLFACFYCSYIFCNSFPSVLPLEYRQIPFLKFHFTSVFLSGKENKTSPQFQRMKRASLKTKEAGQERPMPWSADSLSRLDLVSDTLFQ